MERFSLHNILLYSPLNQKTIAYEKQTINAENGGVLVFASIISCETLPVLDEEIKDEEIKQEQQFSTKQLMNRISKFTETSEDVSLRLVPIDYKIARDDIEMGLNYHMTQSSPITTTRSDTFSVASQIEIQGNDTVIFADYVVDLYSDIYDKIVYHTRQMNLPDSSGEKFIMIVDLRFSQDFKDFIVDFQVGVKANPNTSPGYCAPKWVVKPTFNRGGCGPDLNTAPSNSDGTNEMNIRLNDPLCNPFLTVNPTGYFNIMVETRRFSNGGLVPLATFWEGSPDSCFSKGDQSYYMGIGTTTARNNRPNYSVGNTTGKKSIITYEFRDDFYLCGGCSSHFHFLNVRYAVAVPLDDDASNIPKNLPTL